MRRASTMLPLLLAAILAQGGAAAAAEGRTDYVILMSGAEAGAMSVAVEGHTRRTVMRYDDRGRGPDTRSTIVTDSDLRPASLTVDGVDYYKLPVGERFSRRGHRAVWRAADDRGESDDAGVYFPDEWNAEHLAVLARALLRAPDRALPLLPSGTARIERLLDHEVVADGRRRRFTLFLIRGLDFAPQPIWLDERQDLVLEGPDWLTTVRADLVGSTGALLEAQAVALDARDLARAPQLMRRPGGAVAFRGVALFDAEVRAMRSDMTVVIEGNRITMVGATADVPVPPAAEVIEGAGRTLLPGLWDMHVHLTSNVEGLLHLGAGVTSVRDLANAIRELAARKQRFDEGLLPGPRIVRAGFIDGPGPLAGPVKVLASTPEELRTAVVRYAEAGYTQIKLYSSLDPALVPIAAAEAHRLGLRLSGHIPAGMTMREAVAAGYDEVNHLNFAALNAMGPEINARTNGITRLTAIAEHAWALDLDAAPTRDLIALLQVHGTTLDPTFGLYADSLLGRPGQPAPTLSHAAARLPPAVRRASLGAGLARGPAETARNARSYQRMQELLLRLHQAGVPLVPGTDGMAGLAYHAELELWVEAGIPAADVLQAATLGSARAAGLESRLGSTRPGKLADLILVAGDPVARIADLRNVELVMKDGVFFDPGRLQAEAGLRP